MRPAFRSTTNSRRRRARSTPSTSTPRRSLPAASCASSKRAATTSPRSGPTPRAPGAPDARRRTPTLAPRTRRRLADALVRSLAAARSAGARRPRQRLGSRGLLPLGQAPPARRRRVGKRDPRPALSVGPQRLGVDRRRLPPLSRLSRRTLRRLLAAMVRRSSRVARRLVRDAGATASSTLQKFLHARTARRLRRLSNRLVVRS